MIRSDTPTLPKSKISRYLISRIFLIHKICKNFYQWNITSIQHVHCDDGMFLRQLYMRDLHLLTQLCRRRVIVLIVSRWICLSVLPHDLCEYLVFMVCLHWIVNAWMWRFQLLENLCYCQWWSQEGSFKLHFWFPW